MKTKYDRQFLKIDMINSNFNQDNSNDAFNIGIKIEDECDYDEEQGAHQIFNSGNYDNTHFDIITLGHSKKKKSKSWGTNSLSHVRILDQAEAPYYNY